MTRSHERRSLRRSFDYERARDAARAIGRPQSKLRFTSNRTLDSIRLEGMHPKLVEVTGPALAQIDARSDGVRIGAMARNADVAQHPAIATRYPALTEALRSGGSSIELDGATRSFGVFGIGEHWIASHPADTYVALVALDAMVHTRGPRGTRAVAITELTTPPEAGELVTHIQLPATRLSPSSRYVKVRDPWRTDRRAKRDTGEQGHEFAISSAVVALEIDGWRIRDARVALGAVATRPWRAWEVERALIGHPPTLDTYRRAAAHASLGLATTTSARSRTDTELMIVRALIRTAS